MRVRRRAYWTPAPVRVSLDLSVGSHLPEGDDIGASTVGTVGALLSCRLSCPPYSVPMIGRTRASGADDVTSRPKLRKLRFQMIDDSSLQSSLSVGLVARIIAFTRCEDE